MSPSEWREKVPAAAEAIARRGVRVIYPKVFLHPGEKFECAGLVADNYFVFPNGRVYRCPLCEDFPVHSLIFEDDRLVDAPRLNENDFFRLNIAEGCVMNALIQPDNPAGGDSAVLSKIACCLLKEEILPPGYRRGDRMEALSIAENHCAAREQEMDARDSPRNWDSRRRRSMSTSCTSSARLRLAGTFRPHPQPVPAVRLRV